MPATSSNLYYYGTSVKVRLGDRVEVRGWFGVKYRGFVSYIPGLSPKRDELEYDGVRQWAITADNESTYPILYDPEHVQPRKSIRFIMRTANTGALPSGELL